VANGNGQDSASEGRAKKMRSPSYPGINLETAIKRARGFYQHERRNAAPFAVAATHWGFGAKSSGAFVTIAALKSFGLMEELDRAASGRIVKLTDAALRIILDERPVSLEREAQIKISALRPKAHAALWKKYGVSLPSDSTLRHELIFSERFNENTVDEFVREYKETIRFAKLTASDTVAEEAEDKSEDSDSEEEREDGVQEPARDSNSGTPKMPPPAPRKDPGTLLTQALVVSIPRSFRVDINVHGDELKKEDLTKIKSQFNRWIEGLEEAFEE
jgi:hypothetical protein